MLFGLSRPSKLLPKTGGKASHSSTSIMLRRLFGGRKNPKALATFIGLILLTNWLLFGNAFLGPFAGTSQPPSTKSFRHLLTKSQLNMMQKSFGYQGRNVIPVESLEIIPKVEDMPMLKQLSLDNLFKTEVHGNEGNEKKRYYYTQSFFQDEDTPDGTELTKADKALAEFRQLGRKEYAGSKTPSVVLVMGLDFEKYDEEYTRAVLKNRRDYAAKHGFGLYVRWVQEFTPRLQETGNDGTTWWRPLIVREAITAFANSKFFWFFDEKGLIVRQDLDVEQYVLKPEAMDKVMQRNQPIVLPESAIKTYRNVPANEISFVLIQDNFGLNTDSFVVKNDLYGTTFLEYWGDTLFRGYGSFKDNEVKALSHILQWHPYLLSKTTILPARSINSMHTDQRAKIDEARSYQKGDFVVNLRNCEFSGTCGSLAELYAKR